MPRPGPRPYECVRRAWHSDRHQPMRGSLIQEIFRVVNEIHCSATKKNKEWQEKLPIVVLKAEEIMYSKANSEAEYMELKTLCERLNDAIDTIIRRDESTETAELLHPCIEAALNLGCTPRRASRSQRHNNPRFYLSPNPHEPITIAPKMSNNTTQHLYPHLLSHKPSIQATNPRFMSHHSAFTTPTILNSVPVCSESSNPVIENNSIPAPLEFPFSSENFHQPGNGQSIAIAMSSLSKPACVYPLYYGLPVQIGGTNSNLQLPKDPNSEMIVASSVSIQTPVEPAEMRVLQDLLSRDGAANASNCISESDLRNATDNPPETDFDLTLRLGVLAAPCAGGEDKLTPEIEDIDSSSSQEDSKLHDLLTDMGKDFHLFSKENAGDPSESCSSRWSHEGGILNTEASNRKRKAHVRECVEDGQFSWQPGLPSTDFFGRMKRSGL